MFLELSSREILENAGSISAEIAKRHAESEFEKFRIVQDRLYESDFDREIKALEENAKSLRGTGKGRRTEK